MSGPLALVGAQEWSEGCTFDAELLAASGGDEVVVLPTAAAFENPDKVIERAEAWFASLGATVRPLRVLGRPDALDAAHVDVVAKARFIYLAGQSPLHLRSALKDTPVLEALRSAWDKGAVLAGADESASALVDPMFDPRGGALTVGLGFLTGIAVVPLDDGDDVAHHRRTLELAGAGVAVVCLTPRTAVIRDPDGTWRSAGTGTITVHVGGEERDLSVLP